jgi:PAS domain S-box-containing protein
VYWGTLILTHSQSIEVVVDLADLASLNKKSVIYVLHVDDDPSLQEITKLMLLDLNSSFEIDNASCVDEGFKKLSTGHYDVVVSDYEMPQKDGLQFLKELRAAKNEIPFILFTGKGREEVAIMALNLGADGYFNKQGNPETVYGELTHALFSVVKNKKTQEALTRSELRATALASIGDAVIATDTSGKVTFMNLAAEKLTGWNPHEALQKPVTQVFNIINEQTRIDVDDLVKLVLEKKIIVRLFDRTLLVRKDGSEISVDDSAAPIKDKEGNITGVVLIFRDITQSRNAEQIIFDEREFAQNIMATMRESLLVLDDNLKVVSANDSFYRTFEATSKETEGKCIYDLGDCQWDIPKLHELLEKIIPTQSFFANFEVEHDFPKIGHRTMLLNARQMLQRVKGANLILVAFEDVTERKKAEEELKNSHKLGLINEKLRVVGSLTRHDVGNKMMTAKSNLYLLRKKIGDSTDLVKYLDNIDSALVSSDMIFEFSRLYEKIGVEKPSKENVFEIFNKAAIRIPNLTNVEILNECKGLEVVADSLLKQLFYNFIDNSLKHGQKVTQIRLHYTKEDEVKLFYEDNGVGVPETNKSKLFEAGFTTGKSSGLGLYLVKKMMDVYGWTITEDGEPGTGAKFTITIPKLNKAGKENYQITQ